MDDPFTPITIHNECFIPAHPDFSVADLHICQGTVPWHKAGITLTQLKTGAWDINEQVEGVHFNFLPYSVADENLTSRKFKEEWCTLQMTDVVKSRKETVNGKEKRFWRLWKLSWQLSRI